MNSELAKNLITRVAIGDIFRRKAWTIPNHEALVEKRGDTFLRVTYKELNDQLNRFVRALRGLGLEKGDKVCLLGLNSVEFTISLYGCGKGGFIAVPLNATLSPQDIAYIINHSEAKALIVDEMLYPLVNAIKDNIPEIKHIIGIPIMKDDVPDNFINFNDMLRGLSTEEIEDVIIEDRDLFQIMYTSGTTAKPKGVMISHLGMFIISLSNIIEWKAVDEDLIAPALAPLFHSAQQAFTTAVLHMGGKKILFRSFDPTETLEAIQREKLNFLLALPVMYIAMLAHPKIKEFDLSSIRICLYALNISKEDLEHAMNVFGGKWSAGVGQTECFPSTNTFKTKWQLKKHSKSYWGESALTLDTEVMDDNGNFLKPFEIGEIVWRGPNTMEGYYKDPVATEKSVQYGWHHSGDLGYFDDDGVLVFTDRKKDLIKTGGENVPSVKVEHAIMKIPGVLKVAVVGLPHKRWDEAVTAFIVPKEEGKITDEDVIEHCKKELGDFEVPKKVVFLDSLPESTINKVKKNVLREEYGNLYD